MNKIILLGLSSRVLYLSNEFKVIFTQFYSLDVHNDQCVSVCVCVCVCTREDAHMMSVWTYSFVHAHTHVCLVYLSATGYANDHRFNAE